MKILIVDDSTLIRERLSSVISAIPGVDAVYHAENADEAIQKLNAVTPDVAILDIRMPKGNGFSVLKHIKQEKPRTLVIMLTNYPYEQYKKKAFELGADYFFDKSTSTDDAINVVEKFAAEHEKNEEQS